MKQEKYICGNCLGDIKIHKEGMFWSYWCKACNKFINNPKSIITDIKLK